jgi:hypothetical protein
MFRISRSGLFCFFVKLNLKKKMWKKSGAWFYKEVPSLPPSRPCSAMADISSSQIMIMENNNNQRSSSSICQLDSPTAHSLCSTGPTSRRHLGGHDYHRKQQQIINSNIRRTVTTNEPVPIPAEHQQRF